jgi:formyl-CoA transferase
MLLGDYGAEVVKIERPEQGDDTRSWGPPWVGKVQDRLSAYYVCVNRNKRSVTLNLKTTDGQALARRLIFKSDIVIENFKVGQMAEYGLNYDRLKVDHPGVIYCSLTGYGQDGPYAQRPGYDYVIQGQSGLMGITGPAEGPPYKVGVAISDVITGLYASNAILTALHYREKTGRGQYIDMALLDAQIAALVNVTSNYLISGQRPRRYGNGHPNIVPYEAFEAADGMFILAAGNDRQFNALCELIGRQELAEDGRFSTNPARVENRVSLVAILRPIFKSRPVKAWVEDLVERGIPAGEINDIPEVFANEQVQAREMTEQVEMGNGVKVAMVRSPARLSETPAQTRQAPPLLGHHTAEVLREWLTVNDERLADYRHRGII